jgi:hypothetical protein
LIALLAATAILLTNCESPETTNLIDIQPSFGTVDADCLMAIEGGGEYGTKLDVLTAIHELIPSIFADRKSVNSAHSHIDNVARKVCDGDYPAATKMAWSFLLQVSQQVDGEPAKQAPPYSGWASELGSLAFVLAWDPDSAAGPLEIPEGAFFPSGGVSGVSTRKGGIAFTRDYQAAAAVAPDDYPDGSQVYIALSRTYDNHLAIPGFGKVVPAGYWIMASDWAEGDGVLVQMCVVQPDGMSPEEFYNDYFPGLQLGHDRDGTSILLPRVTTGLSIECSGAAPYLSPDEVVSSEWLGSLGRFAATAFRKAFGPEPLRAWRAGGVGLGGRTKSFSPFAPVDPLSSLSLTIEPTEATIHEGESVALTAKLHNPYQVTGVEPTFSWSATPAGVVSISEGTVAVEPTLVSQVSDATGLDVGTEATAAVTVTHPQTGLTATAYVTVLPLLEIEVIVENRAEEQTTSSISVPGVCSVGPDATCSGILEFAPDEAVRLEGTATQMSKAFDIWVTTGDGQCNEDRFSWDGTAGSGKGYCTFTMTPETTWIKFLLSSGGG